MRSATHTRVPVGGRLRAGRVEVDCPVREVLDRVGDKWSVAIVVRLGRGTHRFTELHRAIDGISQRMLTLTLRALVRDGLVERTVYPDVPPRVEYALTGLGRTLLVPLAALNEWAVAHRDDVRAARRRHDRAASDSTASGSAGSDRAAKTGARKTRAARTGAARTGAARTGATATGAVKTGAAKARPTRTGAAGRRAAAGRGSADRVG